VKHRRLAACLVLGFSSGLPLELTQKALQAWLTLEKVDIRTIGFFALVTWPYSLKFLWAPLLDRFAPPFLGRRRGWIVLLQAALALATLGFSLCDPRRGLEILAALCVLTAFLSASQDIVFDAWRVDSLDESSVGTGTGLGILGYRLALLVTGSTALMLAPDLGWPKVYMGLALLQALLVLGTFFAPEPSVKVVPPRSLEASVVEPFKAFVSRWSWGGALSILGFVVFFKWGVYLVGSMSMTFLLKMGYAQREVGAVLGGMGLIATILGTLAGAAAMAKLPLGRALGLFGLAQAVCSLLFWRLAGMDHDLGWMTAAVVSENFFMGMGSAALVAFMTRVCDVRFSATQFALLSSLMAASRGPLTAWSGAWAKSLGWSGFFLLALAASLPGLLLLPRALKAVREDAA